MTGRRPRPLPARPATALVAGMTLLLSGCASGPAMLGHPMPDHMDGMMGSRSSGVGNASAPLDGAARITIDAGELWFEPDLIEIAAGEPVNLTITNRGRVFHDLVAAELNLRLDVDPGDTATGGLTVEQPGRYTLACSVPGHATAGMQGTLAVR